MTDERWLPIPGYEGRYEVSDMGRVRSYLCRGWHQWHLRALNPHMLATRLRHGGYKRLDLWSNGTKHGCHVHQLVLLAFVGPRPAGHESAHLNGNPADNRLVNLAYVTPSENARHKHDHGTALVGSRQPMAKLRESVIPAIRSRLRAGITHERIAAEFGVSDTTIWRVAHRKHWKHVPEIPV